jgi:hypothetical protein
MDSHRIMRMEAELHRMRESLARIEEALPHLAEERRPHYHHEDARQAAQVAVFRGSPGTRGRCACRDDRTAAGAAVVGDGLDEARAFLL